MLRAFVRPLALAALVLSPAPLLAEAPEESPGRLTISGQGRAAAVPDVAMVRVGVLAEAKSAADAMDEVSAKAGAVIEAAKSRGVEPRDLRTAELRLEPVYEYDAPRREGRPPEIVGFRASNVVAVTVRDLPQVGEMLGAMIGAGGNRLDQIAFAVEDEEALLTEARKAAVADARRKAELYAEGFGVALGRILSISEAGGVRPMASDMMVRRAAVAESALAVPVEAGETTIRASVSVVWELAQPAGN